MRLCYISRNYKHPQGGGSKAKSDIERTLSEMGAVNLGFARTTRKSMLYDFFRNLGGICRAFLRVRAGDIVVLQYPMKKWFEPVCRVVRLRGGRTVAIIHDLGSFRRKRLTVEREIRRLNRADVVAAATPFEREWLVRHGCRAHVTVYGVHDYRTEHPVVSTRPDPPPVPAADGRIGYSICFVGNLDPLRNRYLYTFGALLKHTPLYCYGARFDGAAAAPSMHCLGFAVDTELMASNRGDFGLVWYGDDVDGGTGFLGSYMPFNSPHKLSLYLRCGMPVILWRRAGLAGFVEREGIGLCVDSLREVEERLRQLPLSEYRRMRANAERMARRIAEGASCRAAVQEALAWIGRTMPEPRER